MQKNNYLKALENRNQFWSVVKLGVIVCYAAMPRLLPRRKEREPGDEEKRIVKAQLHFIHELSLRNRSVDIIHIHFFPCFVRNTLWGGRNWRCLNFSPSGRDLWLRKRFLQMNVWKIIYLNCGERYKDMIDHRNYPHNLSSCEIKAWNKFRPERNSSFRPEFFSGFN